MLTARETERERQLLCQLGPSRVYFPRGGGGGGIQAGESQGKNRW